MAKSTNYGATWSELTSNPAGQYCWSRGGLTVSYDGQITSAAGYDCTTSDSNVWTSVDGGKRSQAALYAALERFIVYTQA